MSRVMLCFCLMILAIVLCCENKPHTTKQKKAPKKKVVQKKAVQKKKPKNIVKVKPKPKPKKISQESLLAKLYAGTISKKELKILAPYQNNLLEKAKTKKISDKEIKDLKILVRNSDKSKQDRSIQSIIEAKNYSCIQKIMDDKNLCSRVFLLISHKNIPAPIAKHGLTHPNVEIRNRMFFLLGGTDISEEIEHLIIKTFKEADYIPQKHLQLLLTKFEKGNISDEQIEISKAILVNKKRPRSLKETIIKAAIALEKKAFPLLQTAIDEDFCITVFSAFSKTIPVPIIKHGLGHTNTKIRNQAFLFLVQRNIEIPQELETLTTKAIKETGLISQKYLQMLLARLKAGKISNNEIEISKFILNSKKYKKALKEKIIKSVGTEKKAYLVLQTAIDTGFCDLAYSSFKSVPVTLIKYGLTHKNSGVRKQVFALLPKYNIETSEEIDKLIIKFLEDMNRIPQKYMQMLFKRFKNNGISNFELYALKSFLTNKYRQISLKKEIVKFAIDMGEKTYLLLQVAMDIGLADIVFKDIAKPVPAFLIKHGLAHSNIKICNQTFLWILQNQIKVPQELEKLVIEAYDRLTYIPKKDLQRLLERFAKGDSANYELEILKAFLKNRNVRYFFKGKIIKVAIDKGEQGILQAAIDAKFCGAIFTSKPVPASVIKYGLTHPNAQIRRQVFLALSNSNTKIPQEAQEHIIKALENSKGVIFVHAFSLVYKNSLNVPKETLLNILKKNRSTSVKKNAIGLLVKKHNYTLKDLTNIFLQSDHAVQMSIVNYFPHIKVDNPILKIALEKNAKMAKILLDKLHGQMPENIIDLGIKSANADIRILLLTYVAKKKHKKAIDFILPSLDDSEVQVRICALEALYSLQAKLAPQLITKLLNSTTEGELK